ncbi:hypothetical protein BDR06DRAFT_954695 [Suillus hirtellus]|nr:hypothetical protein BDR06DRAFT_954695 [Suillus hirtellus]
MSVHCLHENDQSGLVYPASVVALMVVVDLIHLISSMLDGFTLGYHHLHDLEDLRVSPRKV